MLWNHVIVTRDKRLSATPEFDLILIDRAQRLCKKLSICFIKMDSDHPNKDKCKQYQWNYPVELKRFKTQVKDYQKKDTDGQA
jgi:hypothetical protein